MTRSYYLCLRLLNGALNTRFPLKMVAAGPKYILLFGSLFLLTAIIIMRRKKDNLSPGTEFKTSWRSVNEAPELNIPREYRPAKTEGVVGEDLRNTSLPKRRQRLKALRSQKKESQLNVRQRAPPINKSNMTVGILVAKRERPTIYYLLEHLLSEPRVTEDFVIIVHVAYSVSQDEELLEYLRRLKNVVTIVEEKPHPEAMEENINDTRGDSMERTVWRTTHGEVITIM